MKKALISPHEVCEAGFRVADVCSEEFPVAQPLFWVDCEDSTTMDGFWYDPQDAQIKPIPEPNPVLQVQPSVQGAETL